MDSRLLNVLRDDPFDGGFSTKYDNDVNFWSSGSDAMGMQLTETLHGILPIVDTEDATEIYEHAMLKDDFQLTHGDDTSVDGNALIYESFTDDHLTVDSIGAIEIVTLDPNADIDKVSESDSDDIVEELLYTDEEDELDAVEFDKHSSCSNSTFRTRTDSSSIGDYESHTSDYDDDEEDYHERREQLEAVLQKQKPLVDDFFSDNGLFISDELILEPGLALAACSKKRTISANTTGSDVDGLGVHIDANTFDLTDFITKDDIVLHSTVTAIPAIKKTTSSTKTITTTKSVSSTSQNAQQNAEIAAKAHNASIVQIMSSKYNDTDSDSDVIVDVETVELDVAEQQTLKTIEFSNLLDDDDVAFVDNVRGDPSWSPKEERKKNDTTGKEASKSQIKNNINTQQDNSARNFFIIPNKRQCNLLKGKLPNSIRASKKQAGKKSQPVQARADNGILSEIVPKVGIGQGSKNLAFIKHDRESISQQEEKLSDVLTAELKQKEVSPTQAIKRKLNLEEYKKRRGDNVNVVLNNNSNNLEAITTQNTECANSCKPSTGIGGKNVPHASNPPVAHHKHSEAVTSIVKSLKQQQTCQQPATDPITVAKNKVLRMQELKRAQQLKIIDSTVSAKVPRVTKLLPLKEIIKDTYASAPHKELKQENAAIPFKNPHSDYEEIIIVSASCNTDISIPPLNVFRDLQFNSAAMQHVNDASRSLLKSSVLLYNISNTVKKAQVAESMKISSNSLISSIQDVVVKQTLPLVEQEANAPTQAVASADAPTQHGEDKIIMHLHKDRIRKRMATIATQTDFQPELLTLFPTASSAATITTMSSTSTSKVIRIPKRRQYRRRERREHSHTENSDSDASHRSRSRSAVADSCSSTELVRHSEVTTSGSYSSRSSRRHRSSISSSYSECERVSRQRQRQRYSSYKQKCRHRKHARSCSSSSASSSSSTLSDYSGRSRSRSRNGNRNRTRSRSPLQSRWQQRGYINNNQYNYIDRNVSQPAVEERRIVYVGRIEQDTTKEILRRKFLPYGSIHQITIHYKETGMKYGFVTYERSQDAFTVIDSGARDPQISMYDISFGGRRAFCRATYADLDNAGMNTYHSYVFPKVTAPAPQEDSFEALLLKVKAKMGANKAASNASSTSGASKI